MSYSQNLYNLHQPRRMHGRFSEDREWSRCDNRLPAFHERSRTTSMHDGILSSPAIEIDPGLVVSGFLLDSGPSLHHQQDRLLQQSPGGSRQISGGQATINFACSCTPDHAEKEVRPDLRRHPRQAPLASSRAKDPVQDWGVGLPMSPWERSILPIGDAHCSGGCLWSSIASISCSWGLGHSPH